MTSDKENKHLTYAVPIPKDSICTRSLNMTNVQTATSNKEGRPITS